MCLCHWPLICQADISLAATCGGRTWDFGAVRGVRASVDIYLLG